MKRPNTHYPRSLISHSAASQLSMAIVMFREHLVPHLTGPWSSGGRPWPDRWNVGLRPWLRVPAPGQGRHLITEIPRQAGGGWRAPGAGLGVQALFCQPFRIWGWLFSFRPLSRWFSNFLTTCFSSVDWTSTLHPVFPHPPASADFFKALHSNALGVLLLPFCLLAQVALPLALFDRYKEVWTAPEGRQPRAADSRPSR